MDFVNETKLNYSGLKHALWRCRLKVGRLLSYFTAPHQELENLETLFRVQSARSPGNRLSPAEIKDLESFRSDVQDTSTRRDFFESRPLDQTFQGLVVPVIEKLIEEDREIRSVLDIGANFAFIDHWLARKYPHILFQCVDFPPNMVEFNAEFKRDNMAFIAGYALECLEQEIVRGDIAYFSSTATVIKNAELRHYLRLLSERSRYVLFNEPLFYLPGKGLKDPSSIALDHSEPIFLQPVYMPGRQGPLCKVHNYKLMLDEAGYEVIHYRAWIPQFTDMHWVQALGRKNTVTD